MIDPSLRSIISGATIWISQWLATTLLSRILRNWLVGDAAHRPVIGVGGGVADQDVDRAELRAASRRPGAAGRPWRRCWPGRRSRVPAPCFALIASATSSQASALRLEITTLAPCSASALGDRPADAPRRAGDDGDLAGEIEQVHRALRADSCIRIWGAVAETGIVAFLVVAMASSLAETADRYQPAPGRSRGLNRHAEAPMFPAPT